MKHIEVVGGILIYNGKILCMKRNAGKYEYLSYKYEFPGGKVEPGETNPEALMRELKEELDIEIHISNNQYFSTVNYQYPDFEVTMHCYLCPVSSDQFVRKEHAEHQWLSVENLSTLDWAPADIPIVHKLQEAKNLE